MKEKKRIIIPRSVPKPANGTPRASQRKVRGISDAVARNESINPEAVINLSGLYEWAKIPLKARSKTLKV